jgi:ParB family chromosome partitioning protein
MEHVKHLISIPLSNLVASPLNVRRHTPTQIEELAALIDAQGLLQNLLVTEHVAGRGSTRKQKFAVVAGERRRRAMLLLQQHGRLPNDHEVLCEVVPPERGLEVSVAENSGREAMHPADEFEAFRVLTAQGHGIEYVATRFGVSPLTVHRRLKLAALSPKLLALYREGGVNLEQLMALTLSDDHAVQERTWYDAQPWNRTPAALRRVLTAGGIEATGSALVRFVGIEDYEVAGGFVRRDLFDDDQSGYLSDADLLHRLAQQKLDALADAIRQEGWAWTEARVGLDSVGLRQFTVCPHSTRKPTAEERTALGELDAREAELACEYEAVNESGEWSAADAERIDLEEQDIGLRRRAIEAGLRRWTDEAKARAGIIVTIGREGEAEVIRGLLREAERKAMAPSRKAAAELDQAAEPSKEVGADDNSDAATDQPRRPSHSESLMRSLTAHRTAALQSVLAANTQVALAALAHVMVQRMFGEDFERPRSALQITLQLPHHQLLGAADDLADSRAWQACTAKRTAWRERLPQDRESWLAWLIALPQAELLELLAFCTASTLNAVASTEGAHEAGAIADAVQLDMADWWEPTKDGYLSRVSKTQIVQALKEAGPDLADAGVSDCKKDELVAKAASRLAGRRWLPIPLRQTRQ